MSKKEEKVNLKEGFQGAAFGAMEGIVMMLGVIFGLSNIGDKRILLVGLLVAGLADAFANAAGMHVSEEAEVKNKKIYHKPKEVISSTVFCFIFTLLAVILLTIPIIMFRLNIALIVSAVVGLLCITCLGYYIGKIRKGKKLKLIFEYLIIAVIASVACYGLGIIAKLMII